MDWSNLAAAEMPRGYSEHVHCFRRKSSVTWQKVGRKQKGRRQRTTTRLTRLHTPYSVTAARTTEKHKLAGTVQRSTSSCSYSTVAGIYRFLITPTVANQVPQMNQLDFWCQVWPNRRWCRIVLNRSAVKLEYGSWCTERRKFRVCSTPPRVNARSYTGLIFWAVGGLHADKAVA